MRALGYCRVSTDEQGDSGLGMEAQTATIRREVEHRGWTLETIHSDVASGKSTKRRPDLALALDALDAGRADVLVVAKLDRLSRSVPDFAAMLARCARGGWALNVCDLGVDTTTPNGKMVAQIMMVLAEWEREVIGSRTKDALAAARDRGTILGRPVSTSLEAEALIRVLRGSGESLGAVARALNDHSVPTAHGGKQWYPSTVRAVERRMAA